MQPEPPFRRAVPTTPADRAAELRIVFAECPRHLTVSAQRNFMKQLYVRGRDVDPVVTDMKACTGTSKPRRSPLGRRPLDPKEPVKLPRLEFRALSPLRAPNGAGAWRPGASARPWRLAGGRRRRRNRI